MSSVMANKYPVTTWWERKHAQRGVTDVNPTVGAEISYPVVPTKQFPESDPVGRSYPERYSSFATMANLNYGQVYGDMPETKILADRDRKPLLQVGFMCPFVGTQNAFPSYSK
jgi:hypothetical protein